MSKQDDLFHPEGVDEQIEQLSHEHTEDMPFSSGTQLLADLRLLYEEDHEIVEQVWARLVAQATEKRRATAEQGVVQSRSPQKMRGDRQKGYQLMKSVSIEKRSQRKSWHFLEMLVAVIIIAVVVGSMILVLQKKQTSQMPLRPSNPTPAALTATDTGLYLSTASGIDKVSLQSGKVLWHVPRASAGLPVVMGGIVFFDGAVSANSAEADSFVEAVSATTGKQLWHKNYGSSKFLLPAHGILYDSSCLSEPNGQPGGCYIYAINPANGTLLWSFADLGRSAWMRTVQDNVVYGASSANLFALDATTGRLLWRKTLAYPYQEAIFTPLIRNHVLYTASCNYSKLMADYLTCYFLAFNATDGAEIWHTHVNHLIWTDPAGADGVIYYGGSDHVYAVNASNGSIMWTYATCTGNCGVASVKAAQGILYIQQGSPTFPLLALSLSNRHVLWSKNLGSFYTYDTETWILDHGLLYVATSQNNVEALNARSGAVVKSYTAAAVEKINAFAVVSQNG